MRGFTKTPPAGFPPDLVWLWGTLGDAAERGLAVFASAGSPPRAKAKAADLEARTRRLLLFVPGGAGAVDAGAERAAYVDQAERLIAEWEVFELEHSGAAAAREERLKLARETYEEASAPPPGPIEKAVSTAGFIALAVVGLVLYKALT